MNNSLAAIFTLVCLVEFVHLNPVTLALAKALLGDQLDPAMMSNLGPMNSPRFSRDMLLASTFAMSGEEFLPLLLMLAQKNGKFPAAAANPIPTQLGASTTLQTGTDTAVPLPELR